MAVEITIIIAITTELVAVIAASGKCSQVT